MWFDPPVTVRGQGHRSGHKDLTIAQRAAAVCCRLSCSSTVISRHDSGDADGLRPVKLEERVLRARDWGAGWWEVVWVR